MQRLPPLIKPGDAFKIDRGEYAKRGYFKRRGTTLVNTSLSYKELNEVREECGDFAPSLFGRIEGHADPAEWMDPQPRPNTQGVSETQTVPDPLPAT